MIDELDSIQKEVFIFSYYKLKKRKVKAQKKKKIHCKWNKSQ